MSDREPAALGFGDRIWRKTRGVVGQVVRVDVSPGTEGS